MKAPTHCIVPDRMLFDHVAEFAYAPVERLEALLAQDQFGYSDSLSKLVQTIGLGHILGSADPRATHPDRQEKIEFSIKLKDALKESGRIEYLEYFPPETREQRLSNAYRRLKEDWGRICSELDDFKSDASVAFLGHLGREFHLVFLDENAKVKRHYCNEEVALELPEKFRARALNQTLDLAKQYGVVKLEKEFENWISECATTHYRIFYEYYLYLGAGSSVEYMPAGTRSSLRFLVRDDDMEVVDLVVPYVALTALAKVKQRRDLAPRVAEWADMHGRKIGGGLSDLLEDYRTARDDEERKRITSTVERRLSSPGLSPKLTIAADILRLARSAIRREADFDAAIDAYKVTRSATYRWLWLIRSPDVKAEWRRKIRDLAAMPS